MKKLFYLCALNVSLVILWSGCTKTKEAVAPTPTIASFSPGEGMTGMSVVITGSNFSATAASNLVKFNGTLATVSAATATSLTVNVPAGASTGKITVQSGTQTATSGSDFVVLQPIIITGFSPASGGEGTSVVLSGSNFSAVAANNVVKFNGTAAVVTAATSTSLTVVVPQGASTGKISVQTGTQSASSTTDFEVKSTTIEFTVRDGNSWTPQNYVMNAVAGATITLYDNREDVTNNVVKYTAVTDVSGKATIPVAYTDYSYTVQKGNAKNIYNGLLITGVFQSHEEVDSSPKQSPYASPGSVRFADINADDVINDGDKINSGTVKTVQHENVTVEVVIYQ